MGERCRGEIENALNSEPIDTGVAGIEKPICRLHVNAGGRWRTVCGIRIDSDLHDSRNHDLPSPRDCSRRGDGAATHQYEASRLRIWRRPAISEVRHVAAIAEVAHVSSSYVVVKFDPPIQ